MNGVKTASFSALISISEVGKNRTEPGLENRGAGGERSMMGNCLPLRQKFKVLDSSEIGKTLDPACRGFLVLEILH